MHTERSPLERLLHRWFVQYNPSYLASAALVVVGLTLLSRGLAHDTSLFGQLAVGLASEAYALCLIGGAALLVRLRLPRPATFVGLIAVLYQGDLALSTETHALLGSIGWLCSAVFFVLFAVKLRALAWALKLRLSRSAMLVPLLFGAGLAVVPHLVRALGTTLTSAFVALWAFATVFAGLWTSREVSSQRPLDTWGETVRRRALAATWLIWSSLGLLHVTFWVLQYHLDTGALLIALPLLATRSLRRERDVLACVLSVSLFAGITQPHFLPLTALLSATVLAVHAFVRPSAPPDEVSAMPEYRGGPAWLPELRPFERTPDVERTRMLAWSGFALYLAVWSAIASFPQHVVALELALAVPMLVVARSQRRVLVPLLSTWTHWGIAGGLLRAPRTTLQWGATTLVAGFVLLFASLFASYRLRDT